MEITHSRNTRSKDKTEKLDPFVKNKLRSARVLFLDEPNYNN
jgi:hypothetical protein